MTGNTSSTHGFDELKGGCLRPFGLLWTVGAEAAVSVWDNQRSTAALHICPIWELA